MTHLRDLRTVIQEISDMKKRKMIHKAIQEI